MIETVAKVLSLVQPRDRLRAAYLLVGMVVSCALEMLGIGLIFPVLWLLVRTDASNPALSYLRDTFGLQGTGQVIVAAVTVLCVTYLLKDAFRAVLLDRLIRFAYGVRAKINFELLKTYLDQGWLFHTRVNSSELIRNLTTETYALTTYIFVPSLLALADILLLVAVLAALLYFDPLATAIIMASFGISAGLFLAVTRKVSRRIGDERQMYSGRALKALHHAFHAIKDIKILGVEQPFADAYEQAKSRYLEAERKTTFLALVPAMWIELSLVLSLTATVAVMVAQGRDIATLLPTLGVFGGAALRLTPSVTRIVRALQDVHFGLTAVNVIVADLRMKDAAGTVPAREADKEPSPAYLGAHALSFKFDDSKPLLEGVSLTVNKGEIVGVFGASGSGKSTFIDVMLGLLAPSSGQIVFRQREVGGDHRGYRARVGYVPQSIYLLDDTIRNNIAFGIAQDEIDDASVWRALELAQLTGLVRSLNGSLDAEVGERGVRLSGGQRQRLGIARALYRDPEVLFLDEATSSLDARTESEFMETIRSLRGSKTVVIVAHRSSTLKFCDRVFELRGGRLFSESRAMPAREPA